MPHLVDTHEYLNSITHPSYERSETKLESKKSIYLNLSLFDGLFPYLLVIRSNLQQGVGHLYSAEETLLSKASLQKGHGASKYPDDDWVMFVLLRFKIIPCTG